MEKEKKKWETPKLLCLYRGRTEEAVLQGCKTTLGQHLTGSNKNCTNPNCVSQIATS